MRLLLIPNYITLLKNGKTKKLKILIELYKKYSTILNGVIIISGIIFAKYFIVIFLGEFYLEKGLILCYFSYKKGTSEGILEVRREDKELIEVILEERGKTTP